MSSTTITSANSVFRLIVPDLYPYGVYLEGYATDKAFSSDTMDIAETMMGVDGMLAGGYTPCPCKQTISFLANSPSKYIFDTIYRTSKTNREIMYMNAVISLPGPGSIYTFTNGVLVNWKTVPDAQKVLQPMDAVITWESVTISSF